MKKDTSKVDFASYDFVMYNNDHITPPNNTNLAEWFTHAHSVDEINAKLRTNLPDRYNDIDNDSYHITDTENADFDKGLFTTVTPYEKEKLQILKNLNKDEENL